MKREGTALRLISGDLDRQFHINGVTLRLAPEDGHLPRVAALVVEQDTGLLLDEAVVLGQGDGGGGDITGGLLWEEYDYPQGTVLRRRGVPPRVNLVIYDLGQTPSWNVPGIERALTNLFAMLPRLGVDSLAMPALAHRHGGLTVVNFLGLLCDYLAVHELPWRGDLWLLLPRESLHAALAALHTLCDIHRP